MINFLGIVYGMRNKRPYAVRTVWLRFSGKEKIYTAVIGVENNTADIRRTGITALFRIKRIENTLTADILLRFDHA